MPILYALVARDTAVLAEYSASAGNANSVARRILENLPTGPDALHESRVSYSQDEHLFHVAVHGGTVYLCMADEAFGRRIPYAFLEDVRAAFTTAHSDEEVRDAIAYAFNAEFSRVLSRKMERYSTHPTADTISRVRGEITDVKNVMIENIEKVLDRGGGKRDSEMYSYHQMFIVRDLVCF